MRVRCATLRCRNARWERRNARCEATRGASHTRGIIRVHQFDKVEAFVYCRPEEAESEHQRLLGWQRRMLELIEVPYRVIDVAAGEKISSGSSLPFTTMGSLASKRT